MGASDWVGSLSEEYQCYLDPSAPGSTRMTVARALAPLPPRELVIVLCALTGDPEVPVAEAARGSLTTLPDEVLEAAGAASLPFAAWAIVLPTLTGRDHLVARLMLAPSTPEAVVAALAAHVVLPAELALLTDEGVVNEDNVAGVVRALEGGEAGEVGGEVQVGGDGGGDDEATLERVKKWVPAYKQVAKLNMAQKVALAMRGNKEARTLLVRDRNRVVATAAIRNPRITEQEVVSAVQSRSVCEEVIRAIATTKDLVRSYAVKMALVANPKTPLPQTMHLLPLLRTADVERLAKSKNVSSAVAAQARRLVQSHAKK